MYYRSRGVGPNRPHRRRRLHTGSRLRAAALIVLPRRHAAAVVTVSRYLPHGIPACRQPCPRHRHQRQWTVHGTPPAPPWVRSQRNAGLLKLALLCLPTFAQLPGLPRRPHSPRRQSMVSWRHCALPNLHRLAGRSSRSSRRGGRKRRARRCCKSTRSSRSRSRSQRLRKPTRLILLLRRSHCRVEGFTAYRIPRVVAVAG